MKNKDANVPRPAKKGILRRILKFMMKYYKAYLAVVLICLVISAVTSSISSLFINQFITYINDGLEIYAERGKDAALAVLMPKVTMAVLFLACIYLAGLICNFTYTRLMSYVTQGTL